MVDREDDDRWSDDETCAIEFSPADVSDEDTPYLIILSGSRVGEMVKVKESVVIGRGDAAELRVRDDGVSRMHARVEYAGGKATIRDLGSRNGTFVNGQRLEQSEEVLNDGDKILIGSITILKFSYADKTEESFQRHMYNSALRDPLTGLYNRRFLLSQLEAEFSYSVRHQTSLSVVMMDIDFFKPINDTYGHTAGDKVLVTLANLLKGAIRTEDLAARYGGEEFVLVCRGIPAPIARTVVDRIRRMVEASSLVPDEPGRRVTISAGVASVPHPSVPSATALIDAADRALYEAKRGGRNRVEVF